MAIIEPGASDAAGRRLRMAALLVLAVCVFGIFACDFLVASGVGRDQPSSHNNGFRLYALHEPPFLWLLVAFAIVVWLLARRWGAVGAPRPRPSARSLAAPALLAALAVMLAAVAGSVAVMHTALRPAALVNPLLAAISILSLAGASARLWPGDVRRGRLAILYLATSTQFLFVSMTAETWAAHLTFNLLWFYLVLRDDRFGLAAAPLVGVAALALQTPLPHALFAAPFVLRLLRTRRVGWIGYYGAVYSVGALALYRWTSFSNADVGQSRALDVFGVPGSERFFVQGMNLAALLTWQAPAMALFVAAALLLVRVVKPAERDLMAGLILMFAFYFMFGGTDGHNWGYRHLYPALGTAALLAASATVAIAGQRGGALVSRLVVVSAAMALLIQLPLRAIQAGRATHAGALASRLRSTPTLDQPRAAPKPSPRRP